MTFYGLAHGELTAQNSHQRPQLEIIEACSRHFWIPRLPERPAFDTKENARREVEGHQERDQYP